MSVVGGVVHAYLVSVSDKLAKQFAKKRPNFTPWTGPSIDQLIQFFKENNKEPVKEEPAPTTNGTTTITTTTEITKKGKKRKFAEVSVEEPTPPAAGEKKSKKKKKKAKASPIVAVVENPVAEEEPPAAPLAPPPALETPVIEPAVVEEPVAVEVEVEESKENEETNNKPKKSKLKKGTSNSFRRVKEEEIVIKKRELANNDFDAKQGADGYGKIANEILKFTKGKSFRHEKTKKKRGTYKGGPINMGVTSIKFDSDSD